MTVTLESIRAAAVTIRGEVIRTPIVRSGPLSDATGVEIFLKLETLQRTGSFKDRGAFVKLKSVSQEGGKGVIAISAGNHAQGVAYHAQRLGIPATIVMPKVTPFTKIVRTRDFGARVVLEGESVSDGKPFADEIAAAEKLVFVHPYDDPDIVSGQGTIGLEIFEDIPDLDAIVVPIGGGGVIAGIAMAAKELNPKIEIIGVEAQLYPSMYQAIHGLPPTSGGVSIAEGIAVKAPSVITKEIISRYVDDIILVDELSLESAVQTMVETGKLVVEGAGAAPLAAIRQQQNRFEGRRIGLIACGANIDSRLLSSILLRGMIRLGRMARLRVEISDQPGVLSRVTEKIGDVGGNIVEIYHQRMFYDVPVKRAEADIVMETRDAAHIEEIIDRLTAAGFRTRRLDDTASEMY
ncbi:MAG: threonine ammonia-lyase [Alphaproteobacteria bacterium]|nr:threonine ammonia-lyase [Alphaproteobacteria bacterium]